MKPGANPQTAVQRAAATLQGFLMEQEKQAQAALLKSAPMRNGAWDGLYVALPVLAILIVWHLRRRGLQV